MKIRIKYIIAAVIVVVVSAAGIYKYMSEKNKPVTKLEDSQEDKYTLITGSGTVKPSESFQVSAAVSGKVTGAYFKEGDTVKAEDLLYEIDTADAKMNIDKLSNALEQAKLALKNDIIQKGYLNIYAPFDGQVSNILVKEGNVISQGANTLTLTDRTKLKLTLQFNEVQIKQMKPGQKAIVYISNLNQTAEGTLSYINTSSSGNSEKSAKLYNVEILLDNPGALKEGQYANADIITETGKVSGSQDGILTYLQSVTLQSNSAGQIESINLKEDQFVEKGTLLMTLQNNTVTAAIEADNLKIQDLEKQLNYAEKQLEDYKIFAPMDGTILTQNLKKGEMIRSGEVFAVLADLNKLELVVNIDDSDIANLRLGQKASVKFDAFSGDSQKPIELEITKLPVSGNVSNGITTYPVTLALSNMPAIKIGMNANIEIKIDKNK